MDVSAIVFLTLFVPGLLFLCGFMVVALVRDLRPRTGDFVGPARHRKNAAEWVMWIALRPVAQVVRWASRGRGCK